MLAAPALIPMMPRRIDQFAAGGAMAKIKTVCPISRQQFTDKAPTLTISVGDRTFKASPRQFSTGSLGWYVNDKMDIEIDGKPVTIQLGFNLTVVGSKELPKPPGAETPAPEPAGE
jgi:hypothetical protein